MLFVPVSERITRKNERKPKKKTNKLQRHAERTMFIQFERWNYCLHEKIISLIVTEYAADFVEAITIELEF